MLKNACCTCIISFAGFKGLNKDARIDGMLTNIMRMPLIHAHSFMHPCIIDAKMDGTF